MTYNLQDRFAPHTECFGCGPANAKGLRLKSVPQGDIVVAEWMPEPYHAAFPGVLNGGIIGTLLDCHSNWAAAYFFMQAMNRESPPCTVTADYHIFLKRPTPTNVPLRLVAECRSIEGDRARIHATLYANDKKCATCEGLFVAVKPEHPAYREYTNTST